MFGRRFFFSRPFSRGARGFSPSCPDPTRASVCVATYHVSISAMAHFGLADHTASGPLPLIFSLCCNVLRCLRRRRRSRQNHLGGQASPGVQRRGERQGRRGRPPPRQVSDGRGKASRKCGVFHPQLFCKLRSITAVVTWPCRCSLSTRVRELPAVHGRHLTLTFFGLVPMVCRRSWLLSSIAAVPFAMVCHER